MRILVLSDSHSGLSFMKEAARKLRPDAVIHLGDYYDDGAAIAEEFPHIPFHQVPGNCDRYRSVQYHPETLCYDVCGVRLYMTHGHLQRVKLGLWKLVEEANQSGAQAALYGHTHEADCHREKSGLWVLNPGACGSFGGSVGLMTVENGAILNCRILRQKDLEEEQGSPENGKTQRSFLMEG